MSLNCTSGESFYGPSLASVCSAPNFLLFMTALDACVQMNEKISGRSERITPVESPDDVYDFIVVGGGAGGAVVAARLSEISDWKVLLLEAGPDETAGAQIPSFAAKFLGTDMTWKYNTTNESHVCQSTNGSCTLMTGRNLGGSTVHNFMTYLRGNPTDYNNWAALGNEGWTWEEVKPFFLKAENNGEIDRVGTDHHATGGPLSVSRFSHLPALGYSFLEGAEELGYGVSDDLNGETITGFSFTQSVTKNGVRHSSASAYLRPNRNRKNLHISLNSFVTKVIIKDGKTIGVDFYKNDELKRVYMTKEVIVSAGAIRSPYLLLHSGIGPKEHLESLGIEVIKDLPGVGENFHDHPATTVTFTVNQTDIYENNWAVAAEYLDSQTGPMAGTGLSSLVGMVASNLTDPDYPDIEIFIGGYKPDCAPGEIDALRSTGLRSINTLPFYLHPKSRGKISLVSNDPFENPNVWANYLNDSRDVTSLVKGIKISLEFINTEAFRRHNLTLSVTPLEACSDYEFISDEYWACSVKQIFNSSCHYAGTCKMGNSSDTMAVVDPQLRVYGIKGLRVADASIMPQVTSGNTGAPTMMIGERAAEFIKKDWCHRSGQRTFHDAKGPERLNRKYWRNKRPSVNIPRC